MRHLMRAILFAAAALAQVSQGPVNLDFKNSEPGKVPSGWLAPVANRGFPATATDQCSKPDTLCGVIRSEGSPTGPFGNLMQYFDAAPYHNRRIRFRAAVRVDPQSNTRAQ